MLDWSQPDKSANFIDKCEKTDRTEPWNLKLFQQNKISCFGYNKIALSFTVRNVYFVNRKSFILIYIIILSSLEQLALREIASGSVRYFRGKTNKQIISAGH